MYLTFLYLEAHGTLPHNVYIQTSFLYIKHQAFFELPAGCRCRVVYIWKPRSKSLKFQTAKLARGRRKHSQILKFQSARATAPPPRKGCSTPLVRRTVPGTRKFCSLIPPLSLLDFVTSRHCVRSDKVLMTRLLLCSCVLGFLDSNGASIFRYARRSMAVSKAQLHVH